MEEANMQGMDDAIFLNVIIFTSNLINNIEKIVSKGEFKRIRFRLKKNQLKVSSEPWVFF